MHAIVFIDLEINNNGKIADIGAVKSDGLELHTKSVPQFFDFINDCKYLCGQNIFAHDLKYLSYGLPINIKYIDTLLISPLLFPEKPYHSILKDYKVVADDINNPLLDAKNTKVLFEGEVKVFNSLNLILKVIYYNLLNNIDEFTAFFEIVNYKSKNLNLNDLVISYFKDKICENAPLDFIINNHPVELAYALALITTVKQESITPPWITKNYPKVEEIIHLLKGSKCNGCNYCNKTFDEHLALKRLFDYDHFREYDNEPLQFKAVKAALEDKSILVIFPTGGGKSVAFQLPALLAGENEKGLTVVISPLQSLMKDQVDNLEAKDIIEAATINGSQDPIERVKAFERVEKGIASILYISPESLRSKSIETLLLKRNVVRFVVDEAHCFSAWGQDFRVDYLYIADFILMLQKIKNKKIPVSCFTATAKLNVIEDIKKYFYKKLNLELEIFKASISRKNLSYHVYNEDSEKNKYNKLCDLLKKDDKPKIIYVSRTKKAVDLANKLSGHGFAAVAYHGKMDPKIKIMNQNTFMSGEVNIIVATTAFGMGVDKNDVYMVIHYDISDSLENYVQEAGRAGRSEEINAECYILFNDDDLNKHFLLLNESKLSIKEIQQIWKAIKSVKKEEVSYSPLEIARMAGWGEDSDSELETKVKSAINALEQIGYVKRGHNLPRIFANSILVKNLEEARSKIENSIHFKEDEKNKEKAIRIMKNLIGAKSRVRMNESEAEERVDYISDKLGIAKNDVVSIINCLKEERVLADFKDMSANIKRKGNVNHSLEILLLYQSIEKYLFNKLTEEEQLWNIKKLNEELHVINDKITINHLQTIINYWAIRKIVKRVRKDKNHFLIALSTHLKVEKLEKRFALADFIIKYLYQKAKDVKGINEEEVIVEFSVLELKEEFENNLLKDTTDSSEIEETLYYLTKINAMRIEGAFLVIYNAMQINKSKDKEKLKYTNESYASLQRFYESKVEQIHIVGEYAQKMINNKNDAVKFVDDYFNIDYKLFLNKYFKNRQVELHRNLTVSKFNKLFGELSPAQLEIINDDNSRHIVVAAGPGSGKTRLLVHKLAALCLQEVKSEQMLMLTFSRAAVTVFKKRLQELIQDAAFYIPIMTFHYYCFDLLGKMGNLEEAGKIIQLAVDKIRNDEIDQVRTTKLVLVIDEAQDMSEAEYSLVQALIEKNGEEMQIIAVGDDDQNIYAFRNSNPIYFENLITQYGAKKYELLDNYRSKANLVAFANEYGKSICHRIKQTAINAFDKENGILEVYKYNSKNLIVPVVNHLMKQLLTGTTCILTRINSDAINIKGLLNKNNVNAQLVQTNSFFNLFNLLEFRFFIDELKKDDEYYLINDIDWRIAKDNFSNKFSSSLNLSNCLALIKIFEETNKVKYINDFEQFIRESKLEDDFNCESNTIKISTIHQAKGQEFDNVFLVLSSNSISDDEKRTIYVGLTRAKKNLFIHYEGNCFDKININEMKREYDNYSYELPEELSFELTHEDVFLSYFKYTQKVIDNLISGNELIVDEIGCYYQDKPVLKFSKKFIEEINRQKENGYYLISAFIKYIVFWNNQDEHREIKIVIPEIKFAKKNKVC